MQPMEGLHLLPTMLVSMSYAYIQIQVPGLEVVNW